MLKHQTTNSKMPAKPKDTPKRSIFFIGKYLLKFMGKRKHWYFFGIGLMMVDAACQTLVPMFFRYTLNQLEIDPAGYFENAFWTTLKYALLLACIWLPVAYCAHMIVLTSVVRLVQNLRVGLFNHVQQLSVSFFQKNKAGEISTRLNTDLESVGAALTVSMGLVWSTFLVVYATGMMLWIHTPLTGIFSIFLIIVAFSTWTFLPRIRNLSRKVRDTAGETLASITEFVGLNQLIRSYTCEDFANERIASLSKKVRKRTESLLWRQLLYGDTMSWMLNFIAPFALLFAGGWLVSKGQLLTGDLVAFWGFWIMLGGAVNQFFNGLSQIYGGLSAADRVLDYFEEVPSVKDAPDAISIQVRGAISFRDVTFGYPVDSQRPVLKHFDLEIPAGKTVAIVGPSGSGKSTLLQLLLRFYDPANGAIFVDGHDMRSLVQKNVRSQMGIVPQKGYLFGGTLAENLRLAKAEATDQELIQALKDANAWEFVQDIPGVLQSEIGEGGIQLSGGEVQRISIARIFLKNPPVILLDEATSALDAISESKVNEALARLMENRTAIIIAHRLKTIRSADEICVMENGQLTAQGTHQTLINGNQLYKEFCELQDAA